MANIDSKNVSPEFDELDEFLREVFQLDQSDPERSNAQKCYEMLIERQHEFIGTPLEGVFWNAVSLEAFHIAQAEAINDNTEGAKNYFAISYDASKKGLDIEWEAYVRGTMCYFKGDLAGLKETIPNAGENGQVLKRLSIGLESRGRINYKEDY